MAETVRFPLPSDPRLYVDLKKRLSWADGRALQLANLGAASEAAGQVAFASAMLERSIVGWNLKDEAGNDLPLTDANKADHIAFEDAQAIIQEASKGLAGIAKLDVPNSSTASSRSSQRAARGKTPTSTS